MVIELCGQINRLRLAPNVEGTGGAEENGNNGDLSVIAIV
jgi:hypothetical protein